MRRYIALALGLALALAWHGQPASADSALRLARPVPGQVVTAFAVGDKPWSPGHRGVDLAGHVGEPVRAAAAGRVYYAGFLVDRGVVSIDHGGLRTTYEPLTVTVAAGAWVAAGEVVGYLAGGHESCHGHAACLHWGLTDGEAYFDPLAHLGRPDVRLLPTGIKRSYSSALPSLTGAAAGGTPGSALAWPAQGRAGSPYGMRLHPILGYWRMHWGTDIGAACGSPLFAPADGVVVSSSSGGGHGNHLVMDHGTIKGRRVNVGFSHASSYTVRAGERVTRGQVVGFVGSTGLSTGCHLHLELMLDGSHADPMKWF